jgi:hypothetical protein
MMLDDLIDRGLRGENRGLNSGLVGMNPYHYGVQQGKIYLIGADSGVGKTTLMDFMLLTAIKNAEMLGIPYVIDYFTLEISMREKLAKWLGLMLGLRNPDDPQLRLSSNKILSRVALENRMNEYQTAKVKEYVPSVEAMMQKIRFHDSDVVFNPVSFRNIMRERIMENGTLGKKVLDAEKNVFQYTDYKPHDPRTRIITLIDHIGLTETIRDKTLKQCIDSVSTTAVKMRNIANSTFMICQQFTTDLQESMRSGRNNNPLVPQRMDFGDSRYTYRDADVVFGMVDPIQHGIMNLNGLDLAKCHKLFRRLYLMKNRYGEAGKYVDLLLDPIGWFYNIPRDMDKSEIYHSADGFKLIDI